MFEWLCISIMTILFSYWTLKKVLDKKGLIQRWKARKEKVKSEKIEKMKSTLGKQGLIIEEVERGAIGMDKHKPAEPTVRYYGKETLATV